MEMYQVWTVAISVISIAVEIYVSNRRSRSGRMERERELLEIGKSVDALTAQIRELEKQVDALIAQIRDHSTVERDSEVSTHIYEQQSKMSSLDMGH